MKWKIVNRVRYELLEKIAKRTDNYIEQIRLVNSNLEVQKEKTETLEFALKDFINDYNKKESERKKTASKVGGLQTSLNRQKEKNYALFKRNLEIEEELKKKHRDNEKLEFEIKELKRQLDFFKNHRRAPSMEEYKNYIFRRKECEKRSKKNES